ncbi:antibiotic biosynthesis monooxygenase [soil metagenome]
MIVRIVKLTFRPDAVDDFIGVFNGVKSRIEAVPGCQSLRLYRDAQQENVFFTYSDWDNEESIEAYRQSELFEQIWGRAKLYFDGKPEAWSLVGM